MDFPFFELNWKDMQIEGRQVIPLADMLKRSRGTCRVGGLQSISFEAVNPEIDRIVLRITETAEGTYCFQWDDDEEDWINLGFVRFRPEWGRYMFILRWESCGIRLPGEKKVVPLKEIFSSCVGERFDGVAFTGKEGTALEGRSLMLRLDTDTRLSDDHEEQKCDMFNDVTDDWEFWGVLVKRLPKKSFFK